MTTIAHPNTPAPAAAGHIPPLQNGDRLTRAEFERRFDATPNLKKAELIEGIVYMPPPVSFHYHGAPHADLLALLGTYRAATPGVRAGDNGSIRLDLDNMPQPDAFLIVSPDQGGQAAIDEDDYIVGAPEWIGEISATSASYDLHQKLNVYRRAGVREYLVWRTFDREIDYFVLREGRYDRLPPQAAPARGYRSEIFPGLWLDTEALLAGDLAAALRTLQAGIASPDHAAVAAALQSRHK